jgi:hypothetical protein
VTITAPCSPGVSWLRREGLLTEERGPRGDDGAQLEAHLQACPACQKLHGEIDRLRTSLARATEPVSEPAAGWQRAVFARIEKQKKPRGLRWVATLAPVLAAAAIVLLVWGRTTPEDDGPIGLRFEKGPTAMRSRGEVAAGDRVVITAGVRAPVAELRLYRDDVLLARCDGAGGTNCRRSGATLEAGVVLPAVGRYRVLLVEAPAALPGLTGNFDQDIGILAGISGVTFKQCDGFEVW